MHKSAANLVPIKATNLCVIVSASGMFAYKSSSRYTVRQQRGASTLSSAGAAPTPPGATGVTGATTGAGGGDAPSGNIGVCAPSFSEL